MDKGYTFKLEDLVWMPGALETLAFLKDNSISTAVATNQSGIAKRLYSKKDMDNFHNAMIQEAVANSGEICKFFYCPHNPNSNGKPSCICRKPNSGMIHQALQEFHISPEECIFVGNSNSDKLAADSAGVEYWHIEDSELNFQQLRKYLKC
jgi:D-glycero-D-manno-heptose 1,7-bisphosphate phosphatase